MAKYPFGEIERKWQARWEAEKPARAVEDPAYPKERRRYVLGLGYLQSALRSAPPEMLALRGAAP